MGKRGPKPGFKVQHRISEEWSPKLAYAIGLLAADGCIARTQALIDLTSKDEEQLRNFSQCLGRTLTIGRKGSGHGGAGKKYFRIQFKSVVFYNFLISIGFIPAKSKTLGSLAIPDRYFWDFLRGLYDGDGCFYSYWDPRWRSSFMYYLTFVSASKEHVTWLDHTIWKLSGIRGKITQHRSAYQLRYAKQGTLAIVRKMYPDRDVICLSRKRLKIESALSIVGQQL